MKATRQLHDLGQSLWLDNITRGVLDDGTLQRHYVEALAAPETINTIPEKTLAAFADHGRVQGVLPPDGGDAEAVLAEFKRTGVDDMALAGRLQREGTASFDRSWKDLLDRLAAKRARLAPRDRAGAGAP
jgi:transaldolase